MRAPTASLAAPILALTRRVMALAAVLVLIAWTALPPPPALAHGPSAPAERLTDGAILAAVAVTERLVPAPTPSDDPPGAAAGLGPLPAVARVLRGRERGRPRCGMRRRRAAQPRAPPLS